MVLNRVPRVVVGAAAAVAAVLLIGIGIGALAAGSSVQPTAANTPGAKAQAYCDRFIGHLAGDLGKSESDVRNAIKKAAGETIDDVVKAGEITKERGDRLRDRLNRGPVCSGLLGGHGRPHKGGIPQLMQTYRDAAAGALGISPGELQADLAKGMTLHQVADTKGINEAQFRAALIRNLQPALDAAVRDGKLTSDQEKEILQHLQSRPLPLWDHAFKRRLPTRSPTS